ncbi:MAG: DUF47 domain-containing protein [Chloroflexi bacterium]|nr:DUF47 domain-containing protein [Chloroflexota bacterium]
MPVRFSFLPRNYVFFDLFERSAANLFAGANMLAELFEHWDEREQKVAELRNLEHDNDTLTHDIIEQLHRTFVTPMDREDISALAYRLDDVMDLMDQAATSMLLYKVAEPTEWARKLVQVIVAQTRELETLMPRLRRRDQMKSTIPYLVEINTLENEADDALNAALVELFDDTMPIAEVIKWREIYGDLEGATDRCEDVANVIEGVVLKNV